MTTKIRSSLPKTMDEVLLREISEAYLLPFFSGATIEPDSLTSSASESQVATTTPQSIAFKVNRSDGYRLVFRRDQPFAADSDPAREKRVVEAFVNVLERMSNELKGPLKEDLLSTFQRRVVAEATAEVGEGARLLSIIDQMASWANRLYEGAPIASAVGLDPTVSGLGSIPLSSIAKEDFFAVLSNGFDTMLMLSRELDFIGHTVLHAPLSSSGNCPWRHSAIAQWTSSVNGRIALVLNRLGEILIFRDGQLLFARRGGTWHFLTHGPIIRQMGVPKSEEIRKAIYETALDASFARTGACIGVIAAGSMKKAGDMIAAEDLLEKGLSDKSRAIARIVNGKKFHQLDRTLRQELAAIDGAMVITHEGDIFSVGAILKIRAGSTSGGRTAAAKQLATLGMAVKISQDGGISGYRRDPKNPEVERTAFKMMW